jgi:hypothetical protein
MISSKLSKIAIAMACFSTTIIVDQASNETYFDLDGSFVKSSKPLSFGSRWTTYFMPIADASPDMTPMMITTQIMVMIPMEVAVTVKLTIPKHRVMTS